MNESKKRSVHIYFTKSYCICLVEGCSFETEFKEDMIKHCKKEKHMGEVTLTKTLDYS